MPTDYQSPVPLDPIVLLFMGVAPHLADGTYPSTVRCTCPDQPTLRAIVSRGIIVDAGCPLCGRQHPCEADRSGIGFFPVGVRIF